MPTTPVVLATEDLKAANLRIALAGANGGWLRASLALAKRTDGLALALDAAVLASTLAGLAAEQLQADMCERDRQMARHFARRVA